MLPNHSITFCVFLHWFTFKIDRRCVFSLSKYDLLIFPESLLAGLMSRHFGLFSKFSLFMIFNRHESFAFFHAFNSVANRKFICDVNVCGKENIGLYRDDGLAIIKNRSARLADKTRKELHKVFEQFDLKITAEANLHVVNFLDVTFELTTGKHKPYRNDDPLYIHKHSNQPPSILRQLPTSINKRISTLSSDKQVFHDAVQAYQNALGHTKFAATSLNTCHKRRINNPGTDNATSYDLIFGSVGCENSKYTCMMHVLGKVQSPEPKHSSLFLVVQTCKLKDVHAFIEQFNNLFYTTLGERLRILGENVVILVIFC